MDKDIAGRRHLIHHWYHNHLITLELWILFPKNMCLFVYVITEIPDETDDVFIEMGHMSLVVKQNKKEKP